MIYLDSAALVKLVRHEEASTDLVEWLNQRLGEPLISSALVEVEVPRALRRVAPESLPAVPATLARLYRLEIDVSVRTSAAALADPELRSLDTIHLATAMTLSSELEAFVTYDVKLLRAAAGLGLTVASPGG